VEIFKEEGGRVLSSRRKKSERQQLDLAPSQSFGANRTDDGNFAAVSIKEGGGWRIYA